MTLEQEHQIVCFILMLLSKSLFYCYTLTRVNFIDTQKGHFYLIIPQILTEDLGCGILDII